MASTSRATGVAEALMVPMEEPACRRFCAEVVLNSKNWGASEQLKFFDYVPLAIQRFFVWLDLGMPMIEDPIVRTFHPVGPIADLLVSWGAPSFTLPLGRLPPRVVCTICMLQAPPPFAPASFGSMPSLRSQPPSFWVQLIGDRQQFGTLATMGKSPGPAATITLAAPEYFLSCFALYLLRDPSLSAFPGHQRPGMQGQTGMQGGMAGTGSGMGMQGGGMQGGGMQGGGMGMGGGVGGGVGMGFVRGGPRVDVISPVFERLFLAQLQFHLRHVDYEMATAQESHLSRFFLHLLNEFWVAPNPPVEDIPAGLNNVSLDARSRVPLLHAIRLLIMHVLANPALRRSCEDAQGAPGRPARLTREVSVLGPSVAEMITSLLRTPRPQQGSLEWVTSLMKLWLVFLQPWKAPRLHAHYCVLRRVNLQPGESPVTESAPRTGASDQQRSPDLALYGLEADPLPSPGHQVLLPTILTATLQEYTQQVDMAGSTLGGVASGVASMITGTQAEVPLMPSDGDAESWQGYVAHFQVMYLMLDEFLSTTAMVNLCSRLRSKDGTQSVSSSATQASAGAGGQGVVASLLTQNLLRTPAIAAALRAIGQAVLCLTDPSLVRVLKAIGERHGASGVRGQVLVGPDGAIAPEVVSAVSLAWATLLECRNASVEFQPMLVAISRQLNASPEWALLKLPRVQDVSDNRALSQLASGLWASVKHKLPDQNPGGGPLPALAESSDVIRDVDGALTDLGRQMLTSQGRLCPASQARFVGSEWQKPKQSGEWEWLLYLTFVLATWIDRVLQRGSLAVGGDVFIPKTEWPRMFANWKLTCLLIVSCLWRLCQS